MCDKFDIEGIEQSSNGSGKNDRPGDPLFPLMPRVLEALRAKSMERVRTADESTPQDDYGLILETICGANDDSQAVEQYDGTLGVTSGFVSTHQSAVGQIQWNNNLASLYTNPGNVSGARWCSGTLITNDLFLTAGHCFDQTGGGWQRPRTNGTSNIISSAEIAQNMHVNFNFQVDPAGNPRTEASFPVLQLVEYRLGGLDFAIIRLGGNPGSTWGSAQVAATDATTGEMLCIIGHPAGLPKRIEAGPALTPSGSLIRYDDIDTLGGNSGSGVLRASDGRLVGVHTNGGCSASSPNGTDANFGQRIVALIAASPTLQTLSRPSRKILDDPIATTIARDIGTTIRAADVGGGTFLSADLGGTISAFDLGGTNLALDVGGTLKFRDDVKFPVLDKHPSQDGKFPGFDGPPVFNPSRPVGQAGTFGERPFVLSTPHHCMTWASSSTQDAEVYEAALQQLAELMQQHETAIAELDSQYRQLLTEYQSIAGSQIQ